MSGGVAETVLKRDRMIVLSGLATTIVLSRAYVYLARDMQSMGMEMAMPRKQAWGVGNFALTFVMWAVMRVAVITSYATPMILTFANLNRRRRKRQVPYVPTAVFFVGYLVVWAGFSVLAAAAQWSRHSASLLSPMMATTTPILGGVLLLGPEFTSGRRSSLPACATVDLLWGSF